MNKAVPVFLIAASVIVLISAELNPQRKGIFSINVLTKEEICEELVIALFLQDITGHVQAYYKADWPILCNHETEILSIHKKNDLITIQFGITPQTGAHNNIGYDKLTYVIDSAGKTRLTGYEHFSKKL